MHSASCLFWQLEITALSGISTGNRFWSDLCFSGTNWGSSPALITGCHTLGFTRDCTCCSFPNKVEGMQEEPFLLTEMRQCSRSHQHFLTAHQHHPSSSKSTCKMSFWKPQGMVCRGQGRNPGKREGKRNLSSIIWRVQPKWFVKVVT